MEVNHQQLIEIGLNAVGFLAAAALWLLVYATWQSRHRATTPQAAADTPHGTPGAATADHKPRIQYVDLKGVAAEQPVTNPDGRRDRSQIYSLAKKMLAAGVPTENIKRTLPVSDGELALLEKR